MAAPNGTIWGSVVGGYGKLGLYVTATDTATQRKITTEVWFASKYSVDDSYNNLYFDIFETSNGPATTNKGSFPVKTTVDTGSGWSATNQVMLAKYEQIFNRQKTAFNRYAFAKLSGIDRVGGTMYVSAGLTIPALASYSVAYNANGGSGAPSSQTKWYGESLKLSSTKPTRTGYSFQGWATSASGAVVYAAGANYTANAAVTLYAVWKANTYAVKYDANGGTGAPADQTKTYGQTLKLSSTIPTKQNYNFLGWGTSASATTISYAAGADYTANAAITLYAIWELAYISPRINNLKVRREYDEDNNPCGYISFDFECDRPFVKASWTWEAPEYGSGSDWVWRESLTGDDYGTISADLKSGSISDAFMDLDMEEKHTFTITVTVEDESGYSVARITLPGTNYSFHAKAGGKGAAVGKRSELDGVFEVAYQTKLTGGLLPLVLKPDTDLNSVLIPNTYTGANIASNKYLNCPVESGTFTLLVESCGEDGQLKQTYCNCSKIKPERFSRFYYQGTWGAWFWANTDEYILYENNSGSSETITLAAALSNFRYIEIYFTDNVNKPGGYSKVYSPDGKTICLGIHEGASTIHCRQTLYTASGTTLTPITTTASYFKITTAGAVSVSQGTNYLKIIRVIGRA